MPVELGLLQQDGFLEADEVHARCDPEFFPEMATYLLVRAQGVGLPVGAIQREHQLAPKSFVERMRYDQALEFGHQRPMLTESQAGIEQVAERKCVNARIDLANLAFR